MIKARFGSDVDALVHRVLPFVAKIPLSPDTLTLVGVGVSGGAALAFALEHDFTAGVLLAAAGFFDLIDGVVARAHGSASRWGAFFDSCMDRVSDLLVFAGLAAAAAARADVAGTVLVLWALAASLMTSYTRARAEVDLGNLSVGWMERAERIVILILGAVTGFLVLALWLVAVGSTLTAIQRMVVARRELAKIATGDDAARTGAVRKAS